MLYVIFGLLVLAALYGVGRGIYALMGTTVGNHFYAALAQKVAPEDTVDFAALAEENPEIRAWVRLNDTAINLPVVKTTDNTFYLTHRFDEQKNKLGTPFIDAGNVGDFSDRHTVIYGHALRDGSMFGSLWEYENPNYFMRHPDIQLFLPDGRQLTLAIFACSRVEAVRSAMPISFSSESDFLSFIDGLRENSAFTSNVKVTSSDRIVSFCIALPDGGEGSMLVSCKITETSATNSISDVITDQAPAETTQVPEETPAETTQMPEESPAG